MKIKRKYFTLKINSIVLWVKYMNKTFLLQNIKSNLIKVAITSVFLMNSSYASLDPTRPPYYIKNEHQNNTLNHEYVLNGVIIYNKHRSAIINGITYSIGDRIDNFVLKKITLNSITLSSDKKKLKLYVLKKEAGIKISKTKKRSSQNLNK